MGCKSIVARIAGLVLMLPCVGLAQVLQTDEAATPLPQPVSDPERSLITDSWGYHRTTAVLTDAEGNDVAELEETFGDYYPNFADGDAITLEGLFKWRAEAIDPITDARIAPGHFTPSCGFSVELVLRGGGCQAALGWYNIDDPESTTPPAVEELYELVPPITGRVLDCQSPLSSDFCPLAWDNVNPRQLDAEAWTPVTFDGSAILEDSRYAGGAIGLVIFGDSEGNCSTNKYSLHGQNQKNSAGDAWVTVLSFESTVNPGSFYLAFEDLPMSPEDWRETGALGSLATNDGDFNDQVYFVAVTDCASGGAGGSANGSGGSGNAGGAGSDGGSSANVGGSSTSAGGSTGDGGDSNVETGGSGGFGTPSTVGPSGTTNSTGIGTVSSGGSDAGGSGGAAAGPGELACTPGRQLECTCTDGSEGAQVCRESGDGFSPCDCSGAPPKDSGGCGCRLDPPSAGSMPWVGGLLLLALYARRSSPLVSRVRTRRQCQTR